MEFKEIQTDLDNRYMIINNQAKKDDFITCIRWERLEEFIKDVPMFTDISVFKVKTGTQEEYNNKLIAYLSVRGKRFVKDYFNFTEGKKISGSVYDNDQRLVGSVFNIMADSYNIDFEKFEIVLTNDFQLTDDVKYLVVNYGFNLKINRDK